MDPQRVKEVYERLEILEDRLGYKLRHRGSVPGRLSVDQLEDRVHDLTSYTVELRELVRDLIQAIAARPA
ncbi:MAG: hypothetical protein KDB94_01630 [Acidobacteria bacterium]|nr:hypothetical protein [Acidobacteriota bacterium]MCB9378470.1 hypothetical protein [Holophagales bacterium]